MGSLEGLSGGRNIITNSSNTKGSGHSEKYDIESSKKDRGKKEASINKDNANNTEAARKRTVVAYKYSNKGKASLHEAVILAAKPVFITYENDDGQIRVIEEIQEGNRSIKPPYPEECPFESYEFANIEEVQSFVKQAKSICIDSLYLKAKEFVQEYNEQDYNKTILIATDILFSYFQDKYATTHYVSIVGDNDSGKSSLGITFEATGYRPVYMTDPSAANIFRCLGSIEPGQCTIILDEADKIDKSPEMMAILKTGYQLNGKVPKINTNTLRQEFFFTYGLKVIISERSMSLTEAKGVYDRTFSFTAYAGDPKFDIKETLNPQANAACQSRLDQLRSFRKLLLIYRLVHFNDQVQEIDTGLKRRNRELCKPILQLFYDCKQETHTEIKSMLEHFLAVKKHRKESTIEVALYPIIINLVSEYGTEIPASYVWDRITTGKVTGYYDERRPNEYQTADYGTIYRNSVTNVICDKFGAQRLHKEKGNVLIFDVDKLAKIGRSYDMETNIQLKLPMEARTERSEGSEGFRNEEGIIEQNPDIEFTNKHNDFPKIFEGIQDNNSNNITTKNEKLLDSAIKPSEPSEPSGSNSVSNFRKDQVTPTAIYRLGHSDNFACKNCKIKADRFFMNSHICGKSKKQKDMNNFNILDLIKCKYTVQTDGNNNKYSIVLADPAKGVFYITESSPDYISGQVRMRGRDEGRYPYNYLEMIDHIFGKEENTIEVCSGSIKGRIATSTTTTSSKENEFSLSSILRLPSSSSSSCFTVDINPDSRPDCVTDGQKLDVLPNRQFSRWRCDPPYNARTAIEMYGTDLPIPSRLLKAGARVCKPGSLMFLLLGPQNYQIHPKGVKRVGYIDISVVPNNEIRGLNIYYKYADV
jgi:hypothetical protein